MSEKLFKIPRWIVFFLPWIFFGWCFHEYFYSENYLSFPDIQTFRDIRGLPIYKLSFEYIFSLCMIYLEYFVYIFAWIIWTIVLAPIGYMIYWYGTSLFYFLIIMKFGLVLFWGFVLIAGVTITTFLVWASYHLWTSSMVTLSKEGWRALFSDLFFNFIKGLGGLLVIYLMTYDFW